MATYKRPDGLTALLRSLEVQEFPEGVELEIVIVDNDPPSARAAVDAFRATSEIPTVYLEQPEQNISRTRNMSVAGASGEWIWFVDDDEEAEHDCLAELFALAMKTDADVVFGDVRPKFEKGTPDWIRSAGVFNRPFPVHGRRSTADRTGNTLVRRTVLDLEDHPFDEQFGLTGGEDSDLFSRLRRRGVSLRETPLAVVWESVSEDRATWPWMVKRCKRLGQLYTGKVLRENGGSITATPVAIMLAKATAQVVATALGSLVVWPNLRLRRRLHQRMWVNIGKLDAARPTSEVGHSWS